MCVRVMCVCMCIYVCKYLCEFVCVYVGEYQYLYVSVVGIGKYVCACVRVNMYRDAYVGYMCECARARMYMCVSLKQNE